MSSEIEPNDEGTAQEAMTEHVLVQRTGRAMASEVSIQLAVAPEEVAQAERAANLCMEWYAEVDARLSRFRPQSDLSRLNESAGKWHAASDVLYAAVERAIRAAQETGGLFDPTLLPQLESLGYDRDFDEIAHQERTPDTPSVNAPLSPGGLWRGIELDARRRRIRLPVGARLDLGGIAKGWAADVAIERFCASFANALANAGGDLRLRGFPAPETPWSVGVSNPHGTTQEDAVTVSFSRGGLATSGAVKRWWLRDGRTIHHLLDPRSGAPMRLWTPGMEEASTDQPLIATATALTPTATQAEVAAKVALLRGYPAALRSVEAAWNATIGAEESELAGGSFVAAERDVALILILGTGKLVYSANLLPYLTSWGTEGAPHIAGLCSL
jgi:thiamine biosynthesis lipoprotein